MTPRLFWRLAFFGEAWLMVISLLGLLGPYAEDEYDAMPTWLKVAAWVWAIPLELAKTIKALEVLGIA